MKLIVADKKSIEFAQLKQMGALEIVGKRHCNRPTYDIVEFFCPHCGEKSNVFYTTDNFSHEKAKDWIVQCPACEKDLVNGTDSYCMIIEALENIDKQRV